MALFSRNDDVHDLHHQIAALRKEMASLSRTASKEMASLSRTASKQGAAAYRGASESASDLYDDLSDKVASALPVIRRRARDIEETILENPTRTVAVVGLAALVVTAAILVGSKRR